MSKDASQVTRATYAGKSILAQHGEYYSGRINAERLIADVLHALNSQPYYQDKLTETLVAARRQFELESDE